MFWGVDGGVQVCGVIECVIVYVLMVSASQVGGKYYGVIGRFSPLIHFVCGLGGDDGGVQVCGVVVRYPCYGVTGRLNYAIEFPIIPHKRFSTHE